MSCRAISPPHVGFFAGVGFLLPPWSRFPAASCAPRPPAQLSNVLTFENHGPLIVASNFWESDLAQQGRFVLSVSAGAFRLLVPGGQQLAISDMRAGARRVVISMLPRERWTSGEPALEWAMESQTGISWSRKFTPELVDGAQLLEPEGQWVGAVWNLKKRRPHKCLERPAHIQVVPSLP